MELKVFQLANGCIFNDTEIYRTYTYCFYRQFPNANGFPGFSGNDHACASSRYQAVWPGYEAKLGTYSLCKISSHSLRCSVSCVLLRKHVTWNFLSHELLTLSHDLTTFCSTQSGHIQGFVVTDWFVVLCLVKSTSLGDLHCISQCIQNRGRIATRNIWQRSKNMLSTPRLVLQCSLCLWCSEGSCSNVSTYLFPIQSSFPYSSFPECQEYHYINCRDKIITCVMGEAS